MLLRHSLGLATEAAEVEAAIAAAIADGARTADIDAGRGKALSTTAMTDRILAKLS